MDKRWQYSNSKTFSGVITPPASDDGDRPHIAELLNLLRKRQYGLPSFSKEWNTFTFSPKDFEELQLQLEADQGLWGYVDDKVQSVILNLVYLLI